MAVRAIGQLGLPRGGAATQVLGKASDSDFDFQWVTPTADGGGNVSDEQLDAALQGALEGYVKGTALTNTLSSYATNSALASYQVAVGTDITAAKARGNHTGFQAMSTISGLTSALADKADLINGKVPSSQLPAVSLTDTIPVASQAAMLALTPAQVQPGDVAIRSDGAGAFMLTATDPSQLANWAPLTTAGAAGIISVNGQTGTAGAVVLGKADIGLSNVDNTADAAKPVSTATQTALNLKANSASPTFTGTVTGVTKTHVGLANVDNTSDANKPVSTAQAAALAGKVGTDGSVTQIRVMTQAAYNALATKSTGTLYAIVG